MIGYENAETYFGPDRAQCIAESLYLCAAGGAHAAHILYQWRAALEKFQIPYSKFKIEFYDTIYRSDISKPQHVGIAGADADRGRGRVFVRIV
jgi:hypothetical protein